ncbi:hypothetical protein CCACVL1_28836 [Corchorus capsularis]|uniref:Uncharacterized protein n=1 Tax=Corchorus capsularis TaxID=210143 RepID=A0A1R3G520_COCAP|nr:hypothetical protein CCACVL1_28836 [Corchorus capsularis]
MALEQTCLEAKKTEEENVEENSKMNILVKELEEGMSTTSKSIRSGLKVALSMESGAGSAEQIKSMSDQINEYKLLVKKLKEELRGQKLKAKEEAEDLAQEMAELRYQMMGLLEGERKHVLALNKHHYRE